MEKITSKRAKVNRKTPEWAKKRQADNSWEAKNTPSRQIAACIRGARVLGNICTYGEKP
jgi:hypothetical protein